MEKKYVSFQVREIYKEGSSEVVIKVEGSSTLVQAKATPCAWSVEEKYYIGMGRVDWNSTERVTNRYGSFYLIDDEEEAYAGETPRLVDSKTIEEEGTMYAKVEVARKSSHIGDLFHGIRPATPNKGEVYILGRGKWKTHANPYDAFRDGVEFEFCEKKKGPRLPLDVVYTIVGQTVSLYFVPAKKEV